MAALSSRSGPGYQNKASENPFLIPILANQILIPHYEGTGAVITEGIGQSVYKVIGGHPGRVGKENLRGIQCFAPLSPQVRSYGGHYPLVCPSL